MLTIHAVVDSQPVYTCSFCLYPIDHAEAVTEEWMYCPKCGRELWNQNTNPWR